MTDISYGPVSSSVFDVTPPAGAKVTDLTPQGSNSDQQSGQADSAPVTGLAEVQKAVPFEIAAPDSLAGLLPKRGEADPQR